MEGELGIATEREVPAVNDTERAENLSGEQYYERRVGHHQGAARPGGKVEGGS